MPFRSEDNYYQLRTIVLDPELHMTHFYLISELERIILLHTCLRRDKAKQEIQVPLTQQHTHSLDS